MATADECNYGLSNLLKKNLGKVCRACLKETEAQHTATPPSMA